MKNSLRNYWSIFLLEAFVLGFVFAVLSSCTTGSVSADEDRLFQASGDSSETAPETESRASGKVFRDCAECPEMVVVPAGSFSMGDVSGVGESDEKPVHEVTIKHSFAVGKYEVTRREWEAFVRATGYSTGNTCWRWNDGELDKEGTWRNPGFHQTGQHPVVCLSWRDAQKYVQWLSEETGQAYRLLSEAEWEYVARAGTRTAYHTGSRISSNQANYDGNNDGTVPVGSYAPNAFGLYDVHGNVSEWVEDCWNESYADAPSDGSAQASGDCGRRILRGGAWFGDSMYLRSSNRTGTITGKRLITFGFRIARTLTHDNRPTDRIAANQASDDSSETAPETESRASGKVFRDCAECPEMVVVPAGSFLMGDVSGGGESDEKPVHEVTIKHSFAVGKYEVTRREWEAFVRATGYSTGKTCLQHLGKKGTWRNPGFHQTGQHPVVCVSWHDAQKYVQWLSEETGQAYRLLSEAEWEYVARAGTQTTYHTGSRISPDQANYDENNDGTVPVGSYAPNAFGLYDVHGNAHEWVEDCWSESYADAPSDGSAQTSGDCGQRVSRGGSWVNSRPGRSSGRDWSDAGFRVIIYGFRVARTLTHDNRPTDRIAANQASDDSSETAPETESRASGKVFRDCAECPEMVVVPAGSFLMGDVSGGGESDEKPVHEVTIKHSFAVGKYEVTRREWEAFVRATGYSTGKTCLQHLGKKGTWRNPGFHQTGQHPVVCVSWHDAQKYVQWLSEETGQAYRLLSEAEWEYVARAGTRTAYHTGSRISPDQANYDKNHDGTVTVGSYAPNAFGLYDVHGNVWEWVEDCWNKNYAGAPSDGSAQTSGDCGQRVSRGGAWGFNSGYLRSSVRNWSDASFRVILYGFRVARTLTHDSQPTDRIAANQASDDSSEMAYEAESRTLGEVFRDCAECPEMVVVPAGSFRNPFAVGKYEVTRREWEAFVRATGHSTGNTCARILDPKFNDTGSLIDGNFDKEGSWRNPGFHQTGQHPVTCVNWHDAQEYMQWLSEKTGQAYRLLSEAEWEYVAGPVITDQAHLNSDGTVPVGSYAQNAFGLYDLYGNVWEWIEDCWDDCSSRVVRGGSWFYFPMDLRSSYRDRNDTGFRSNVHGFRIARTLTHDRQPTDRVEADQGNDDSSEMAYEGELRALGEAFQDCAECPEMVVVPAGSFLMGDASGVGESDEKPVHEVTIKHSFAVGKYEVTRREWEAFVRATGYSTGNTCWRYNDGVFDDKGTWRNPGFHQTGQHPVVCVNWHDAQKYVQWLSEETGQAYRLLSEAEWEYVARAGTRTAYYTGSRISPTQANYDKNNDGTAVVVGATVQVGAYAPNTFGLYDVHGNVWEWVEDCWNESYVDAPSDGNAQTRGDCGRRVLRGGSWVNGPGHLRSSGHLGRDAGNRHNTFGFRVARTLTHDNQPTDRITADQASDDSSEMAYETESRALREVFRDCTECPEMVVVPAGNYMRGSASTGRYKVTITEPLAVGVFEVTRREWGAFVRATGYSTGKTCLRLKEGTWRNPGFHQTGQHPVVCVSWHDAQKYVQWLSEETGQAYRLLSEAEWEYVARAGTQTTYHTGSRISPDQANYDENNDGTVPVGSYAPNAFGLYDVHGNVWEWVEDCWNEGYADAPSDGSAQTSEDCGQRVSRGGSWVSNPMYLRFSNRIRDYAGSRNDVIGFRVARTLTP